MNKQQAIQSAILLGGCARSGTTIMGKLLGSLQGVEYFFEPAFLHKFIWQLGNMPDADWQHIFEAYAYDDLLLGAIAGRNLNFNRHDDSCIYNIKSEAEIGERMARSHRKLDLEAQARKHALAFKIPDLVFKVPHLQELYPGIRAVAMVRNPEDTLHSLVSKNWFSDEALHVDSPAPQIDFQQVGAYRVPRWVEPFQVDFWMEASETERCAYYWIRINEHLLGNRSSFHFVSYDQLVADPEQELTTLCKALDLTPGAKTGEILAAIQPRHRDRPAIVATLPDFLRDRIVWVVQDYQEQLAWSEFGTNLTDL